MRISSIGCQYLRKGKNCTLNLSIPALLAMTASLCGQDTKIIGHGNGFSTSTNVYMLAVSDPGGGKSVIYENDIEVMSYIYEKTGLEIGTESYTSAGLQRHQRYQIASKGVGLITSDEGHRFLASVNAKQAKGESERAYLCKMWSGKGDVVELSTGSRGFQNVISWEKLLNSQRYRTSVFIILYLKGTDS